MAARRGQLRVGRRRDPQRHRSAVRTYSKIIDLIHQFIDRDGDGAAGVRARGAGAAQPERRVCVGSELTRAVNHFNPQMGGHGARHQPRHRPRRIRHRQHLPHELRLPLQPAQNYGKR
jgi:hypothetical protein